MIYSERETLDMSKVGMYAKKGGLYFADVLGTYEVEDGRYRLSMWMEAQNFTGGARIVLAARIRQPYELTLNLPDGRFGQVNRIFDNVEVARHISGMKLAVSFYLRVNFDPNYPEDGRIDYGFQLEGKSIKRISETKLGR